MSVADAGVNGLRSGLILRLETPAEVAELARQIAKQLANQNGQTGKLLLDIDELAEMVGLSAPTINRMRREGLPYIKVGTRTKFSSKMVVDWLEGRSCFETRRTRAYREYRERNAELVKRGMEWAAQLPKNRQEKERRDGITTNAENQ